MHVGSNLGDLSPTELSTICQHQCGAMCCRGGYLVHLEADEAARVKALAATRGLTLQLHEEAGRTWWRQDEQDFAHCPFLSAEQDCSIYADRPQACSGYPWHFSPGCRLSGWEPKGQVFVATVHGRVVPFEFGPMRDLILADLARHGMFGGATSVSGVRVDDNRNKAVESFLGTTCEYLLFLDDDMAYPPGIGARLVGHQRDVVCGLYFQRGFPDQVYPHWYRYDQYGADRYGQRGDLYRSIDEEVLTLTRHLPNAAEPITDHKAELIPIDAGGTGVVAIHRRVFERMPPPWFRTEGATNGDLHFFKKAKDLGFAVWGDPGAVCSHYAQALVGLDAFRLVLRRKMDERAKVNSRAAGKVQGAQNSNTPDYWDYTHGTEILLNSRRYYEAADRVEMLLLGQVATKHPVVVDLACGRSFTYPHLRDACPGVRFVGVDFSEVAQADNRKVFPDAQWISSDACASGLPATCAELVLANHFVEHLDEPEPLINEMWRLVKPGGFVAVAFPMAGMLKAPPGEHVQEFDWNRMYALLLPYSQPVWCFPGDEHRGVAVIQKPEATPTSVAPDTLAAVSA